MGPPGYLAAVMVVIAAAITARAQYNTGYGMSGGGYGGDEHGGYADERPKIHLGLRLKIPAIKFELPRLSLPKITISAKIRQPDRPRTIQLPEINLDTSSKVAPPNKMGGGSDYGGGSSYGGGSYGGGEEKTQTFSFSTSGEDHPSYGGSSYGGGNKYGANKYAKQQAAPKMQIYSSQSLYSPSNMNPSYSSANPVDAPAQQIGYYGEAQPPAKQTSQYNQNANPDVGFNAPAYVDSASSSLVGQGDQVSASVGYNTIDTSGALDRPTRQPGQQTVATYRATQTPQQQLQHHHHYQYFGRPLDNYGTLQQGRRFPVGSMSELPDNIERSALSYSNGNSVLQHRAG